ncbi:MAG: SUF system Fe-S cluster assembly protein [Bacteroidales bacterium]|nr:SUF system Fe-S cluster assembly protein [Bacteroidales bacterium]
MTEKNTNKHLENKIIETLKTVFDPEISVNIYDLGLIYKINIDDDKNVKILMTLTSPNCPVAENLPVEVNEKIRVIEGINNAEVELTFEPPWNKEMMTETALLELGLL